jgi:hypothetical protein
LTATALGLSLTSRAKTNISPEVNAADGGALSWGPTHSPWLHAFHDRLAHIFRTGCRMPPDGSLETRTTLKIDSRFVVVIAVNGQIMQTASRRLAKRRLGYLLNALI